MYEKLYELYAKNTGRDHREWRINMCNRCNYDSPDNQIYVDPLTNEYYLDIETSEWDEYDDGFVHQREYIAYCPYCGRKLGE